MPFDATPVEPPDLDVIAVLQLAQRRIRVPQLWCKGAVASGNRVCIMGALNEATSDQWVMHRAYRALENAVGRAVPLWNDDMKRRHADVMAAFDRAIASLR